jgi:excisionase family DNA binding protein
MTRMTNDLAGQRAKPLTDQSDRTRLMSVPTAAKYLGFSAHTLRNVIESGAITHHVVDGSVMLSTAQCDEFLADSVRPRVTASRGL